MNNKQVQGKWSGGKGRVQAEVGHLTGSNKLEGEGIFNRIKGKVEEVAGSIKDSLKEGVDHALNKERKH